MQEHEGTVVDNETISTGHTDNLIQRSWGIAKSLTLSDLFWICLIIWVFSILFSGRPIG